MPATPSPRSGLGGREAGVAEAFPDTIDMHQAAAKLGKSHSWLKAYIRHHPCGRKVGAKRVFTASDFAILLNSFPRDEPCPVPLHSIRLTTAIRRGGFVVPSQAESDFNELQARLKRPKRRSGSESGSGKPTVVSLHPGRA